MQRLDKLNLAQKHWTRNSKESRKPRKSSLRLKQLQWMKTVKDARIARAKNKLKDARIAKIKNESKVEKITMDPYDGLISANCRNYWKCGR